MGIPGLLEQLKSIIRKSHISTLQSCKIGIDAHCYLHKGAYSCSKEIIDGICTDKYVQYFLNLINLLQNNGIKQILVVFDGLPLSNKYITNIKRSESRKKNIQLAKEAEIRGDHQLAQTYYQQSVSITPKMISCLIKALNDNQINYMIAPFEADAQLAYLSQMNIIDVVLTEDSDSIVYGCKAIFYKIDKEGNGDYLLRKDLSNNQTLSFVNWTDDQFKLFCCISGCDYMPKIKSIGIKTAYKIVSKYKTIQKVLEYIIKSNSFNNKEQDIQDISSLVENIDKSVMTFKHQTIYNPLKNCLEYLTPIPQFRISYTWMPTTSTLLLSNTKNIPMDLSFLGVVPNDIIVHDLVNGIYNEQQCIPNNYDNKSNNNNYNNNNNEQPQQKNEKVSESKHSPHNNSMEESSLWRFDVISKENLPFNNNTMNTNRIANNKYNYYHLPQHITSQINTNVNTTITSNNNNCLNNRFQWISNENPLPSIKNIEDQNLAANTYLSHSIQQKRNHYLLSTEFHSHLISDKLSYIRKELILCKHNKNLKLNNDITNINNSNKRFDTTEYLASSFEYDDENRNNTNNNDNNNQYSINNSNNNQYSINSNNNIYNNDNQFHNQSYPSDQLQTETDDTTFFMKNQNYNEITTNKYIDEDLNHKDVHNEINTFSYMNAYQIAQQSMKLLLESNLT